MTGCKDDAFECSWKFYGSLMTRYINVDPSKWMENSDDFDTWPTFEAAEASIDPEKEKPPEGHNCHRCNEYVAMSEPNTIVDGTLVFLCFSCRTNPWR